MRHRARPRPASGRARRGSRPSALRAARGSWSPAISCARRLDQRQPLGAGGGVQLLQRRGADAAARRVDDALEGEVVGRLADQAQIGQRVADFLALVEARAADHPIRQRQRDEALLELAGLEAGAHQDRDFAERVPLALQCLDLVADPARLLLGVPQRRARRLVALLGAGPQGLAEPAAVMRDDAAGGGQDLRGRAVVLLQPDDQRAREIVLEAQDVADLGAAPAVDRLVVVADAAQILVLLRQEPQPQILRDVGVLVLVDQQIAEAPLVSRRGFPGCR